MEMTDFKVKAALDATSETEELNDREKALIGIAVVLTRGCQQCNGGRLEKALASGIPYKAVQEAIDLTAAVNAGVTIRTAIEGADLAKINEACQGEECAVGT